MVCRSSCKDSIFWPWEEGVQIHPSQTKHNPSHVSAKQMVDYIHEKIRPKRWWRWSHDFLLFITEWYYEWHCSYCRVKLTFITTENLRYKIWICKNRFYCYWNQWQILTAILHCEESEQDKWHMDFYYKFSHIHCLSIVFIPSKKSEDLREVFFEKSKPLSIYV